MIQEAISFAATMRDEKATGAEKQAKYAAFTGSLNAPNVADEFEACGLVMKMLEKLGPKDDKFAYLRAALNETAELLQERAQHRRVEALADEQSN